MIRLLPLLLVGFAWPQDPRCECKLREVGQSGSRNDWPGYWKGPITWHFSIDEALKIARTEGKFVFWYHVAGDLDKEGC